jgi:hypothetical protein
MAFRDGNENEELLKCRKCKGAYPMDALFCGFCRAPRNVALGVERDPETPKIVKPPAPKPKIIKEKKPISPERKKKILFVISAAVILPVAIFGIIKYSTRNIQTAGEMELNGPCVINDVAVENIVNLKNSIDNIPTGSNEGENKQIILDWASDADGISKMLKMDEDVSPGTIKTNLYNTVQDLNALISLAKQWANKNYSNPDTFSTSYLSAGEKIREDYKAIATACGDRVPRA